eukprot:Platyproteum_vivax@DN3643_c0_g1_i1.p1
MVSLDFEILSAYDRDSSIDDEADYTLKNLREMELQLSNFLHSKVPTNSKATAFFSMLEGALERQVYQSPKEYNLQANAIEKLYRWYCDYHPDRQARQESAKRFQFNFGPDAKFTTFTPQNSSTYASSWIRSHSRNSQSVSTRVSYVQTSIPEQPTSPASSRRSSTSHQTGDGSDSSSSLALPSLTSALKASRLSVRARRDSTRPPVDPEPTDRSSVTSRPLIVPTRESEYQEDLCNYLDLKDSAALHPISSGITPQLTKQVRAYRQGCQQYRPQESEICENTKKAKREKELRQLYYWLPPPVTVKANLDATQEPTKDASVVDVAKATVQKPSKAQVNSSKLPPTKKTLVTRHIPYLNQGPQLAPAPVLPKIKKRKGKAKGKARPKSKKGSA